MDPWWIGRVYPAEKGPGPRGRSLAQRRRLWNVDAFASHVRRTATVFVPAGLALGVLVAVLVAVLTPEALFGLPRRSPRLWLLVMALYPVFSVYPQELIFRTFFFHRYRALFPNPTVMIGASGAAFGFAHLFFANWIAPVMTTLCGVLFARTYARSRSTLQASLEHALWGDLIFTIGLGLYFYGGAIR